MSNYGIALDLGTSGFRAQAIDLRNNEVVSTAITNRHPLPGANVIDHVNFAIDTGESIGNELILNALNRLLPLLQIDLEKVDKIGVCGNPFQLSLFQGIEIRDLAYAGKKMLESLGVTPQKRDGDIISANELGLRNLTNASVIIPPAVSHEIGADALAMLLMTGAMEQDDPCVVVDYGTNAEMALIIDGEVYSGSAAAGPALEGQQIEMGMLAAPGTISDVNITDKGWDNWILDEEYLPLHCDTINPISGDTVRKSECHGYAKGVTGTGVVAALDCGISAELIKMPNILTPDNVLHLQDGVYITENDVAEAGKAIGAIRAGYLTLMNEVGIWVDDVPISFMSGASGLYVDALKAQRIGMVSPGSSSIIQFGNTSLALAKELTLGRIELDDLKAFAHKLRARHCMFATSETFKNIYAIELSLWTYGMPMNAYNDMLDIYNLPHLPAEPVKANIVRKVERDIPDLGTLGVSVLKDPGTMLRGILEDCTQCHECIRSCPEGALSIEEDTPYPVAVIRSDLCDGTACKRCELACPTHTLILKNMRILDTD
ncbi:MAG: methylamine methyltransferase corrinoid protein reductive activase [Euryarchaeota archaeon]|nr:methylamine methyltransferase corrinoid protein reductive activase [Euryarchaeota archaeon]